MAIDYDSGGRGTGQEAAGRAYGSEGTGRVGALNLGSPYAFKTAGELNQRLPGDPLYWDANDKVNLSQDPHPLAITDPDLFKYPYIYAVEVGQMELNTQEAARLREYLLRGGFWHVDDFWGLRQWGQFERQMKKVFPDRQIEELR